MARLSLSLLTLTLVLCSQAFKIPPSLQYAKRDFNVLEDGVLFSGPDENELFLAISIGDAVVPVQIDIESSDLWVTGPLNQTDYQAVSTHTSQPATPVSGQIGLANVNITHQFYYSSQAPQGWPSPPPTIDTYGRLGLGPTANSQLVKDANDGSHSIIDQLILQENSDPFITLLVSPLETDKGNPLIFNGFMTAGTTVDLSKIFGISPDALSAVGVPVLSKVTNQPKIQLGTNGVFSVDDIQVSGKSVGLTSSVNGAPSGKPVAKLSTTNPWIVAPKSVVDAVYSGVSGASYSSSDRLYHLPCTAEVDVTIIIAGVSYPLSPLDVISTQVGSNQCVGTFQASDGSSQGYDVLMGLPWLRNAYTLYGYASASGNTLSSSYYQFLSITTQADSHALFIQIRSPAPNPAPVPNPAPAVTVTVFTTTTHTPTATVWTSPSASPLTNDKLLAGSLSDDDDDSDLNLPKGGLGDQLRHCMPAIIVLIIVLGLTAIGATVYCVLTRRRQRKMRPSAYRTLHTAEAAEPVHVPLYGADEDRGASRYTDPYKDEER